MVAGVGPVALRELHRRFKRSEVDGLKDVTVKLLGL